MFNMIRSMYIVYNLVLIVHVHIVLVFFNDTATTEIYTLSLHDALPISLTMSLGLNRVNKVNSTEIQDALANDTEQQTAIISDRKSTRLNSSHANISYAVFCLKKKKHTPLTERNNLPLLCCQLSLATAY